ncbi:hypothetical protein PLEOSDRAFT_1092426 [Pleurotus ostreatus PC15]|uniref:Uncharacterized protein n=1 Tax=Pleurotus ostreatus (strain PC15) TaxID=1137138 RepID=A0A067NSZ0_PLEO1|nr:hypothetical protein PLEOSDRAFT_1092426 [Pleurotus ostreatus PC15]
MSVSSRQSSSTSKWWSLSSKTAPASSSKQTNPPKDAPGSAKAASGSKFNTLASAIGFKSKKHPVLAIQEPPYLPRTPSFPNVSPAIELPLQNDRKYMNRPPSKSVSSTKSPVESIGPVTPVEHHNPHRQSLLTLSDQDPFASYGMNAVADPNRLSVYSGSSGSDYMSKKASMQRTSYASSAFSSAGDQQLSPGARWQEPPPALKLKPRRSQGSLHRKVSILSAESSLTSAWESLTHSAKCPASSSPVTPSDPHRLSQPPPNPLPRPPMRARGMTDTGMRQPSFPPSEPSSSTSQSSTRMGGPPPSAPPTHDLPLPPALVDGATADDDSDILPDISTSSTSSSGLSFASSTSSNRDAYFAHSRKPSLEEEPAPQPPPSPLSSPQTLKRALSHQSLIKRRTSASSIASGSATDAPLEKAPRKQRSYPRIPVPPLPQSLRHATSFGPTAPLPSAPTSTQRTSSSHGALPTRGRLFSGPTLRRPSTSQCTPADDDIRPATSSVVDYTPRRIKSPAEMAKIEASVHEAGLTYVRPRGSSFTSVSTTMSDDDYSISAPHSPPTSIHLLPILPPHTGSPLRSASMINKAPPVPRLQVRPSTSQATISPPLPPPPRPRPIRPSTAPLAPPPETPVSASSFVHTPRIVPLAPPPRRKVSVPKLSSERILQRRSLLRKPSFLEIDDDIDKEEPDGIEDSFLDLARESFDTVRTIDE